MDNPRRRVTDEKLPRTEYGVRAEVNGLVVMLSVWADPATIDDVEFDRVVAIACRNAADLIWLLKDR